MPHIQVENLSIEFEVYGTNSRSFRKTMVSSVTGGKLLETQDKVPVRALDSVSLEIAGGERVGLVGHNGSGKTTFLRALAGLYHPKGGRITLHGSVGSLLDPFAGSMAMPRASKISSCSAARSACGMLRSSGNSR